MGADVRLPALTPRSSAWTRAMNSAWGAAAGGKSRCALAPTQARSLLVEAAEAVAWESTSEQNHLYRGSSGHRHSRTFVARPPLISLAKRVAGTSDLARRSAGLVKSSLAYVQRLRAGKSAGPLLLAVRAANDLAQKILEQPSPQPSPAQRRVLLSAAAQIRTLARGVIVSSDARDPESLESELSELIRRTLALIDRVTAEAPVFEVREAAATAVISEPDSAEPERLPPGRRNETGGTERD